MSVTILTRDYWYIIQRRLIMNVNFPIFIQIITWMCKMRSSVPYYMEFKAIQIIENMYFLEDSALIYNKNQYM